MVGRAIIVTAVCITVFLLGGYWIWSDERDKKRRRAEEAAQANRVRYRGVLNPGVVIKKRFGVLGSFYGQCTICGWEGKDSKAYYASEFEKEEIEWYMSHQCPTIDEMEAAKPKTWERVGE